MKTKIIELADEYLNDEEYKRGFIFKKWIDRITQEFSLKELSDEELSNLWDEIYETLDKKMDEVSFKESMKYMDARSAFVEVVNIEARKRQGF